MGDSSMSKLSDFLGGSIFGGGIGGMPIQIVSKNMSLTSNFSYGIDTSYGVIEVTLPSNPLPGDRVILFDAALTWDQNRAIVHVNGHRVEQNTYELDSYSLNKKAGVQELLFINEVSGWKDTSLYKTGVDPMWYGSFLHENYRAEEYVSGRIEADLIHSSSSSESFVIPSSGYYCLLSAGGSGSAYSLNTPIGSLGRGGETSIKDVNGQTYISSSGGNDGKLGNSIYLAKARIPYDVLKAKSFCPESPRFFLERKKRNSSLEDLKEGELFGIEHTTISGGSASNAGTFYYGYGTRESSVVYFIEEGVELILTVGAGGDVTSSSYQGKGKPGSVKIYQLKGL